MGKGNSDDELAGYTTDYCHKIYEVLDTYLDAMQSPESHLWQKAMDEEIEALTERKPLELTTLPVVRSVYSEG